MSFNTKYCKQKRRNCSKQCSMIVSVVYKQKVVGAYSLLTMFTRLYFGLPFDLWDQSHRCSEHTYGIDPKGALRAPMGSIPLVL